MEMQNAHIRTAHSTLVDIKENIEKMEPKEAVRVVYEKAAGVVNASSLSEAVKLLCSFHKRDNIKMKLRKLSVPEKESKEIMNSIFGYQVDSTLCLGLIDSNDANDFQVKLEELKEKWDRLCPSFYKWFVTNEATWFCSSLIRSVHSTAGLGLPPCLYTNNNNESINRVLKEKVCYKKQEWPTFNNKMLQLVLEQQEEYSKAICKCGEYELHENYKHLEISQTDWLRMNPEQRKVKIDKLFKQNIKDDVSILICEDHSLEAVTTLSTDWSKANITYLQPSGVEELWSKAAKLLSTPGFVVPAAGNDCARQVASMSATASCDGLMPPHFVHAKKSGGHDTEVCCDCPVYSSTPKVCQHSLAATDDMGILSDYLTFLRKTKSIGLNLSTLISKELPKSAGQKGTSRRKGAPKGSKKLILKEADPLSLNTSAYAENVPPPESPSSSSPFTPAFTASSPHSNHSSNFCS